MLAFSGRGPCFVCGQSAFVFDQELDALDKIGAPAGQELAGEILETDFCSWWFDKYRGR